MTGVRSNWSNLPTGNFNRNGVHVKDLGFKPKADFLSSALSENGAITEWSVRMEAFT